MICSKLITIAFYIFKTFKRQTFLFRSTKKKEIKPEQNGVQLQNGKHEILNAEQDSEDNKEDSSVNSKKKKKKVNQKEKQKLKKEARNLRAQAMGEGLESLNFSSVALPNGATHESDAQNESIEMKEETKSLKHKRNIHDSHNRPNKKKKLNKSDT